MSALVKFLCARLDQDERMARAAETREGWKIEEKTDGDSLFTEISFFQIYGDAFPWQESARSLLPGDAAHIVRHDPARVLRQVEGLRIVMREHLEEECCAVCLDDVEGCPTLRALAAPYANHKDYRDEWRP
jgi:hypothetical protein